MDTLSLDDEWLQFIQNNDNKKDISISRIIPKEIPICGHINISTKSKIFYFNISVVLEDLFWKLNMISYDVHKEGIIKKQMKFNFNDKNEVRQFEENMKQIHQPIDMRILNQVDNPNGRVLFKDTRKVSIGLSKNDILKPKKKSKSAFYNCFVIIYRLYFKGEYNELHLKLFNSGKVEIPGIKDDSIIPVAIHIIQKILQPYYHEKINEISEKRETILVNSNFNCNFHINRDALFKILKQVYNVKCSYDSCSYPGIQCKYKVDKNEISYMIFRTGSILIVGKCENEMIYEIYDFIKSILHKHFSEIYQESYIVKPIKPKKKISKIIDIA